MSSIEDWLRVELHDVVGYYDKTLAQFILSLANKATSASALHGQLLGSGIDDSPKVRPFAEALFRKTMPAAKKSQTQAQAHAHTHTSGGRQLTNAELIRQSQQYSMVESDDEDFAKALTTTTSGGKDKDKKKEKKEKKKEKKDKHVRKKADEDDEEEEDPSVVRKRIREAKEGAAAAAGGGRKGDGEEEAMDEDTRRQQQLDADIKERDEFVQRMLEKEEGKTKQKAGGGLTAEQIRELATTGSVAKDTEEYLDEARKVSRREYLKKREEKELALIEKELRDEEFLFGDMEVTAEEKERREVKRKVLEMAREKDRFEVEHRGYRMPDSYETADGKLDTEKRDAALLARYQEEEDFKTEQELWEEQRVGVAAFRSGARDKAKVDGQGKVVTAEEAELEEFLFENQIDFVSDQLLRNKLVGEGKKKKKKKKRKKRGEGESSTDESSSEEEGDGGGGGGG